VRDCKRQCLTSLISPLRGTLLLPLKKREKT
jgi:hypothetical protein